MTIQTFKMINGIDKVDKEFFFFKFDSGGIEEGIQVSCSRNVADLIPGKILAVTEL